MKKMKCTFYRVVFCLLCIVLTGNTFAQIAMAEPEATEAPTLTGIQPSVEQEEPDSQHIFLERYELTDEKVIPGNDFTLKLFLKNAGTKDADCVIVDVLNSKGVMPIYGTISQAVISVSAGETAQVVFDYHALERIDSPVLDFQVSIREGALQNAANMRVPVGTKSPFNIIATFVPARVMVGENVNCSITFKNLGKQTADHVRARMDVNGSPVLTSEVGNLPQEMTKTQSLFTTFQEPGKYVIELYLDYRDQAGEENSVLVGTSLLEVYENRGSTINPGDSSQIQEEISNQMNNQFDNTKVLIISGVLIVVIFLIIVFLMKKKK